MLLFVSLPNLCVELALVAWNPSPAQNGQDLEALELHVQRKIQLSNKQPCPEPCVHVCCDVLVL